MRTGLSSTLAVALTVLATPTAAQFISDPGCAAIEEWVSPLIVVRGRGNVEARNRQGELLEQIFSDEATEPVFGLGFSRWQVPQYEAASPITERCVEEARTRNDSDMSTKVGIAMGRIQDRMRRLQAASRNNPTPSQTAPARVNRPDCESLKSWAGILMSEEERRTDAFDGADGMEIQERRRAVLISDDEIEPRFGYPISEWTYNDYSHAGVGISQCANEARAEGDISAHSQLRHAYGYIVGLRNQLR